MPVTGIMFGPPGPAPIPDALDIHLLRGQNTENLRDRIWWGSPDDELWRSFADLPAGDVELLFIPVFKADDHPTDLEFQNFGIRVHKRTGRVTIGSGWDQHLSPHNFIVETYVTDNGDGIPPVKIKPAIIRVHVHLSVKQIWLTPEKLSIRRRTAGGPSTPSEDTHCQFTVRAQFDDDTVGDLSYADGLTFGPAAWFDGKKIRIPPNTPETVSAFTVQVTGSSKWNHKVAEGRLEVLRRWALEQNLTADLIEGRPDVWGGAIKPESVPNILFLGSGFEDADKSSFQMITDSIVHKLKRDPMLQPYGYLATSMNYWGAMAPSPAAGISVCCEVQQFKQGGQLFVTHVPSPLEAPPTSHQWTLQHLIYAAGLPVPDDIILVVNKLTRNPPEGPDNLRDLPVEQLDFQRLFDRWARIMRLDFPVPMINAISKDVVKEWIALVDRTFVDEVNSFPPVAAGTPPAAAENESGIMHYHTLRGRYRDENDRPIHEPVMDFCRQVQATPRNGVTISVEDTNAQRPQIGSLWAEDRPGFAFDNRPFLIALSKSVFGRAVFSGPVGTQTCLTLSTTGNDGGRFVMPGLPVARDAGRSALIAQGLGQDLSLRSETWKAVAHEAAHAFGLLDEYAAIAESSTDPESTWDRGANVMSHAAALVEGETAKLDFGRIKWNWHRIRKASVITLPIEMVTPGTFRIYVRKGSGGQFAVGDFVRLRQRSPRQVLNRAPVTSLVEFRVESIHAENLRHPSDPFNMTLVIRNDAPLAEVTAFDPGSIVYLPVPAPEPRELARPYLTLVSPLAERIMTATGGAMTGDACNIDEEMAKKGQATQIPGALVPAVAAQDLPNLIGAYFGGRYACGVLHPTGQCMMRSVKEDTSKFCHVCRYVMVDRIDPERHWEIDRDHDKKYFL